MIRRSTKGLSQDGAILVTMLLIIALIVLLTDVIFTKFNAEQVMSNQTYRRYQALNVAEAGIQKALYEIRVHGTSYHGESNTNLDTGKFTVELNPSSSSENRIKSTGIVLPKSHYVQKTVIIAEIRLLQGKWQIISWKEQDN